MDMPPMTKEEAEERLRVLSVEVRDLEELLRGYASNELRAEKEKYLSMACQCEHEFRYHGKSFSVNFAAGGCQLCKCYHFIQSLSSSVMSGNAGKPLK